MGTYAESTSSLGVSATLWLAGRALSRFLNGANDYLGERSQPRNTEIGKANDFGIGGVGAVTSELASTVALGPEYAGMRKLFLGTAAATLLGFLGWAQVTSNREDEQAIHKVVAGFVEAWNKHDARAFSMAFAEDADFTNVLGRGAKGRAEIEKFHAPMFATRFKDSRLESGTRSRSDF